MEMSKIKLEIYEGDPFGSSCCGPGPMVTSLEAADRFRQMMIERERTVDRLSKEFQGVVDVQREILSSRRHDYPDYVRRLEFDNKPLPYIFINGEAVMVGKFPSYEEFAALLKSRL